MNTCSRAKVELNFVGCLPPNDVDIPAYVKCHGFVSKAQPEGYKLLQTLLRKSHFLFLPSRAEAYGIAFCEASALWFTIVNFICWRHSHCSERQY